MKSDKIKPKFNKNVHPKIGLIALSSDLIIEKDFNYILKNKNIDLFVNRIERLYCVRMYLGYNCHWF